jgi:hypothetical protein
MDISKIVYICIIAATFRHRGASRHLESQKYSEIIHIHIVIATLTYTLKAILHADADV